jgi:diguanylate cyclase (GGDEF)-like protein
MHLRLPAESRVIAAFLAGALALIVAACFAWSTGRAYVAAEQRIDDLLDAEAVLSQLSTTAAGAPREDAAQALPRGVAEALPRVRAEREAARRRLADVERAFALVALLAIALWCFACALLSRSVREQRRLAAEARDASLHDPLTGMPNGRFLAEWLSYAIAHARRHAAHVGVLVIDISGVGAGVQLHGERTAQLMLVEVARRFRAASREGDMFARVGASEFALATPNAWEDRVEGRQLATIAQRLRNALDDPALPPLADSPIGASIGIAFFPEDADDPAGVMAAANAAMYAARRAGRNHVAFNALAA